MNDTKRQIALSSCILLLYAAFTTRTYYWDGVLFSLNIESVQQGQSPVVTLLHPNHLLYSALGWIVYAAASAVGITARAITILQAINVVASAAAGYILFIFSKRTTESHGTALFCWALFAFGATWWKFSTDADAYILSVLLIILAILLVIDSPPRLVLAAICHTLAMLLHELSVFAYVPIFVAILLNTQWPKAKRFWIALTYLMGTGAGVAVIYLICYLQTDRLTYPSLLRWITSYASNSGFTQSPSQLVNLYLASYLKLFVGGKPVFLRDYFSIPVFLSLAMSLGVWLWALSPWRSSIWRSTANRKVRLILWAWLLPYVIFLASWDPGSAFHKLFLWPAMVLLIGEYTASIRPAVLLAVAISMAAWNFAAFIYPHSHDSADPVLVLAKTVDKQLPRDATIYYSALDTDDWYLKYFAPGRKWVQLSPTADILPGLVCLETTALERLRPAANPQYKWDLVNTHHNIRLECFKRPDFGRPERFLR